MTPTDDTLDLGSAAATDFAAELDDEEARELGEAAADPDRTVPLRLALALASRSSATLVEALEEPGEAADLYLDMAARLGDDTLERWEAERQMLETGLARATIMAAKAVALVEEREPA